MTIKKKKTKMPKKIKAVKKVKRIKKPKKVKRVKKIKKVKKVKKIRKPKKILKKKKTRKRPYQLGNGNVEEGIFKKLFHKTLKRPKENGIAISAKAIYEEMKAADPVAMGNIKETLIWKLLKALKIEKKHYEDGNKYNLVRNQKE